MRSVYGCEASSIACFEITTHAGRNDDRGPRALGTQLGDQLRDSLRRRDENGEIGGCWQRVDGAIALVTRDRAVFRVHEPDRARKTLRSAGFGQ